MRLSRPVARFAAPCSCPWLLEAMAETGRFSMLAQLTANRISINPTPASTQAAIIDHFAA
jgi:hypothetical protein